IAPADPKRLGRLLAELESGSYVVREKAKRELEQLGDLALPALRELQKKPPPLETRRRLEELIPKLEAATCAPELIRLLRAIEVLEQIATADARQVLQILAEGADQHRA